jgi:cysteine-rich repeat protein
MKRFILITALLLAAPATGGPNESTFHLIKIVEMFPGSAVAPNAQYIEMQMYFAGQNFLGNHEVFVYDSVGTQIGVFVFPGSVANGANQASILLATPEAQATFSIAADLAMTPILPLAGGRICFENPQIDCISWGNYSGSALGSGTPFNAPFGLVLGKAVQRDLGGDGVLQATDDTGDSDADFDYGLPTLRNNANNTGFVPSSNCGNGALEGLEGCDDGNTTPGDGCDGNCETEAVCGNGVLEIGEECDDGNTTPGDGCDEFCQSENTCLITLTGDVNVDAVLTSSDIISMVNYVFKGGALPQPCAAAADVGCDGAVTSADIIFMVNYIFKGGIPPCDVCSLVPGTWSCP